jgi:methyltransferase (TIGR00027 family)
VSYVPVNFERQTAMDGLIAAGFDASSPAFFAWLGVTMYLPEETVFAVLRAIAALPPASGVVFDYAIAKSEMSLLGRMAVAAVNQRLKQIGEPWVTFFRPVALATYLNALGFQRIRDLGPKELNVQYFSGRTDGLRVSSVAHVMIASV